MNVKGRGKKSWPNLRKVADICLEELTKNCNNVSQ